MSEYPDDIRIAAEECVINFPCLKGGDRWLICQLIARSLMAERERDQWQDISTAPKDGSWFVAYRGPAVIGTWDRYVFARWHEEFEDFIWPDDAFDILIDDIDERREDGRHAHSPFESAGSFTHWRPLPSPPSIRSTPARGE